MFWCIVKITKSYFYSLVFIIVVVVCCIIQPRLQCWMLGTKMAGSLKKTTCFVGLQVAKRPRETLIGLYNQTLSVLQRMPEDAFYRKETENLTKNRLQLVEQEVDVAKLEKKMNDGLIEEAILQAKSELSLAEKMEEWKAWEPLQTEAPPGQWRWP